MIALWHYLKLPSAVSAFEEEHLATMNRVGVWFYLAHVPVFTLIALVNGTGPILAAVLTTVTAVGPLLAWRMLKPRMASIVMGFTSMIMGALLVHFGQGPLQIEMHFYFFVLLAMLSTFGNPMVILTAAVTVAVHHALLWLLLPSSVFNYDASIWVVAVHALFVVLESTAAIFLARKFFDNVIGLEKIILERTAQLEERNQAVQLLLDNAGEGFLTLDREAHVAAERSAAVEGWFGTIEADQSFQEVLARHDDEAAEWFEFGWESLMEGMLPMEVLLEQLPAKLTIDSKHLALDYKAVELDEEEVPTRVMVVVRDVTAAVERERVEAMARETVELFQRILADRTGFLEFYAETAEIVRNVVAGEQSPAVDKRLLHTLKGNAGLYGIRSLVSVAHALEDELEESAEGTLTAGQRARLDEAWQGFQLRLEKLMGDRDDQRIEIDDVEYEGILRACAAGAPHGEIAHRVRLWKLEPTSKRLDRVKLQAEGIAERLSKSIDVECRASDVRLDPERWAPFWGAFVHAIRNAVDHGVESVEERVGQGKPEQATLAIRAEVAQGEFVVTLADDGRGIDWQGVRARAESLGLMPENVDDLTELLFVEGLSTRDQASEMSGRGVGMAALRAATQELGGTVHVDSEDGAGTRIVFRFPSRTVVPELRLAA